jgi:muramidase (phage lysozyme)
MTPALKNLLAAIRAHEAPKGYGQIYGGAKGVPKDADVSRMTLGGVLDFQQRMLSGGSASTACGGYQFLRKTLAATIQQMRLSLSELWDAELQDRMALHLIENRGLRKFLSGQMSREDFCNALAAEWASLPMVSGPKKGRSKYDGDGLNKSFHSVDSILALVDALKLAAGAPAPDAVAAGEHPEPAAPQRPRGLLLALIELILSIFKRRP